VLQKDIKNKFLENDFLIKNENPGRPLSSRINSK